MLIEDFFLKSLGKWNSMRSGHSLAFKEFEEIVSQIKITSLEKWDIRVLEMLNHRKITNKSFSTPVIIEWESESNWEDSKADNISSGSSILIPFTSTTKTGKILRSTGYAENIKAYTEYNILENDTVIFITRYNQTIAEERIWFISSNVRCRASLIKSINTSAILQTSYASEIRIS